MRAAAAFRPRPRVLDASGDDARILYVTPGYQLVALDAQTGAPIPTFGKNGVVDLKQNDDQDIDPLNGEIGLHADARHREGRRHRRRGAPYRRESEEHAQREGLRARLRRAHRRAAVDLPHDSAARRVRHGDLAQGLGGIHRQHRRLGADLGRRGPRDGLSAGRGGRRAITSARTGPATACSARRCSPSTCTPASASGTTSSCTTASGTTTSRARRSCST